MECRFCQTTLNQTFCDLGASPLSNSYLSKSQLSEMEPHYPLKVWVCSECRLVQIGEFESPQKIFNDEYAYFSSYSSSWLAHCRDFAEKMIERFELNSQSQVIEIASNDGYLLQYFKESSIPVLGIEPTANTARTAIEKGIPSQIRFFGMETAKQLANQMDLADLMVANNVLAHVPDINDFVSGFAWLLKENGVISFEFPHLMSLYECNQFDTIYHEHFSYFSFFVVERILAHHGLTVFDVERLKTHGGSLRVLAKHSGCQKHPLTQAVKDLRKEEIDKGYNTSKLYSLFAERVTTVKNDFVEFLIQCKRQKKKIVGYGAPAKGNTLLNYCGVRNDFLDYTVDLNVHKQTKFLPGSHIPIHAPEKIFETQPDFVVILPWNLRQEISSQLEGIRKWGGQFVVSTPKLEVF